MLSLYSRYLLKETVATLRWFVNSGYIVDSGIEYYVNSRNMKHDGIRFWEILQLSNGTKRRNGFI